MKKQGNYSFNYFRPREIVGCSVIVYSIKKKYNTSTWILYLQMSALVLFFSVAGISGLFIDLGENMSFLERIPAVLFSLLISFAIERGYWFLLIRKCPKSVFIKNGTISLSYLFSYYNFQVDDAKIEEKDDFIIIIVSEKMKFKIGKISYRKTVSNIR